MWGHEMPFLPALICVNASSKEQKVSDKAQSLLVEVNISKHIFKTASENL